MPSSESNKSVASTSSTASETTTIRYGHETWEDFAPRVHRLCRQLWPSASEDEDFIVEKLRGGSYNRIISIEIPLSISETRNRYILRIPRFETAQQEPQLAIARYVRQHTLIPTAEIIFFDATSENPLSEPYVVQTKISGQDLEDAYPHLTHEQKLDVAEQWGRVLLSELTVKNDFAGVVYAAIDETGADIYRIRPFKVDPPDDYTQDVRLISKQSILELLIVQFERWEAADRRLYPDDKLDHFELLTIVAKEMDAAGLFSDSFFSLCHLDLAPRNVMVDVKEDKSLQISGVLDWDSDMFGPSFVVCEPPSWIWARSDTDDEDEEEEEEEEENEEFEDIHANETPIKREDQELKRRFEEVVGEDLLRYFYMPHYRLARSLFYVAVDGLRSNDAFARTNKILQQWKELQAESSPAVHEATELMQQVDIDEDFE